MGERAGTVSPCATRVPASLGVSRGAREASGKDEEPGWRRAIAASCGGIT